LVWVTRLHRGQCWIWKVITILTCTWCPGWSTAQPFCSFSF
jgi:hypothetical protein